MSLAMGHVDKKKKAISYIQEKCKRLAVTLSGGVDSAVLLYIAREALGAEAVLAVTGRSSSMTDSELRDAEEVARFLGCEHKVLETNEMELEQYRANTGDRCFHCRGELFRVSRSWAAGQGYDCVSYGAILDDIGDYRPGMEAAREQGILAPLLAAEMNKSDVRRIAADASLPVKEKPANPCLASRIPIGVEITDENLSQVARAEAAMRDLGFIQFRVRHHGETARLELDERGDAMLDDRELRRKVVEAVRGAGFRFVALDLDGYRTGSMNPETP